MDWSTPGFPYYYVVFFFLLFTIIYLLFTIIIFYFLFFIAENWTNQNIRIYNRMDRLWYRNTEDHNIVMKVSKLLQQQKLSKKARHRIFSVDSKQF